MSVFEQFGTLGTDVLVGSDDTHTGDTILAGDGNDVLIGNDGNDSLLGEDGNDSIRGGTGYDRIEGGEGKDNLRGEGGNDWIYGGAGNDRVFGGSGLDRLFGGEGDDRMIGGLGSDIIEGGDGNDAIYGGDVRGTTADGAVDFFVFDKDDGSDKIFNFEDGTDMLALIAGAGDLSFTYVGDNTIVTYGATEIRVYDAYIDAADIVYADSALDLA